jgi:hypothetical protein
MFSTEILLFIEPKYSKINSIKVNSQSDRNNLEIFKNEILSIREFIKEPLKYFYLKLFYIFSLNQ